MKQYAIYLRKSRADVEAEARGEGETLARHRKALWELAKRRGLNVVKEYAEIGTGDSISARPQMQLLLEDIKLCLYDGVIVNDIDRLSRGAATDQERIKYALIAAHCKIITPTRDIDPENAFDEEMLEWSMHFAKMELHKISQRLMQGRIRSVESGNYICPRIPFGYKQVKDGKRITLEPDPNTAPIVQWIFEQYGNSDRSLNSIVHELNDLGISTTLGNNFHYTSVANILKNPIYIGTIVYGKTKTVTTMEGGEKLKRSVRNDSAISIPSSHEPLISEELFYKVQHRFEENSLTVRVNKNKKVSNPLAGLIYCSACGHAMLKATSKRGEHLYCNTRHCQTVGVELHAIESELINVLKDWSVEYADVPDVKTEVEQKQTEVFERRLATLNARMAKARELVETGAYTPAEFVEQKNMLQRMIAAVKKEMAETSSPTMSRAINVMLPEIKNVIEAYQYAETAEEKNRLLKSVVARVDYTKNVRIFGTHNPMEGVKLVVYPKILM